MCCRLPSQCTAAAAHQLLRTAATKYFRCQCTELSAETSGPKRPQAAPSAQCPARASQEQLHRAPVVCSPQQPTPMQPAQPVGWLHGEAHGHLQRQLASHGCSGPLIPHSAARGRKKKVGCPRGPWPEVGGQGQGLGAKKSNIVKHQPPPPPFRHRRKGRRGKQLQKVGPQAVGCKSWGTKTRPRRS
jgi:hypothetical protein